MTRLHKPGLRRMSSKNHKQIRNTDCSEWEW